MPGTRPGMTETALRFTVASATDVNAARVRDVQRLAKLESRKLLMALTQFHFLRIKRVSRAWN
jgi:hypothetical protein